MSWSVTSAILVRRIKSQTVEKIQPAASEIGEVASGQTRFSASGDRSVDIVLRESLSTQSISSPARAGCLINGLLNAAFPCLAGKHPWDHFIGGKQAARVGANGHVFQRHIGKITTQRIWSMFSYKVLSALRRPSCCNRT